MTGKHFSQAFFFPFQFSLPDFTRCILYNSHFFLFLFVASFFLFLSICFSRAVPRSHFAPSFVQQLSLFFFFFL